MQIPLRIALLAALGGMLSHAAPVFGQAAGSGALEEGLRLLKERRFDEAKRALAAAAAADPGNAEPWIGLGNAHLATQVFREAIAAFEKALALAPDNHTVRYNLAFALRKGDRPRDAAASYRAYLAHKPEDADAWYGLAEALREAKDTDGAAEAYEAYAQRETRPDRQTWVEKARRQAAALGAYSAPAEVEARPAAKESAAIETEPRPSEKATKHQPSPLLEQAHEALSRGRFAAALQLLMPLPEERQKEPYVAAAIAAAHLGKGDFEGAIRWYRSALVVASDPAKPALLFGLAEALRQEGNETSAKEAYAAVVSSEDAALKPLAEERLRALGAR